MAQQQILKFSFRESEDFAIFPTIFMSDIVVQINGAGQRKLNYFGCVGFSYFQDYLLETTVPYVTGLAGILRCPVEERFSTPVLTTCIWEALVDLAWTSLVSKILKIS